MIATIWIIRLMNHVFIDNEEMDQLVRTEKRTKT